MSPLPDLRVLLAGCSEALRLEGRPGYADPDGQAAFARYQRTGTITPPRNHWPRIVRDATRAGTTVGRLRLVSDPLTDYETWQLGVYAVGWAPGEDVRVLPRFRRPYRCDVWILDRTRALWMTYDHTGHLERTDARPADAECQFWARRWDETTETPAAYLADHPSPVPPCFAPDSAPPGRVPSQRSAISDDHPAPRTG